MVQLKAVNEAEALRVTAFQFLMVQLKGSVVGAIGSAQHNFNSLWFN